MEADKAMYGDLEAEHDLETNLQTGTVSVRRLDIVVLGQHLVMRVARQYAICTLMSCSK